MNGKIIILIMLLAAAITVNVFWMRHDTHKYKNAVKLYEVQKGKKVCGIQEKYFRDRISELKGSIKKGQIDEIMKKHVNCVHGLDRLVRKRLEHLSEKEIKFSNVELFQVEDCGDAKVVRYWDVRCNVVDQGKITFRYVVENRSPKLINVL